MPAPILVAENLTKDYGRFRALDDLNLEIAPGEIFGLLGPNGSGKSTAIRMMLGFLRPSAGRVTLAGFDCWQQSVEARRKVAYLPGELRLYETMTGRKLITFLTELRGDTPGADLDEKARRLDIEIDRPLVNMSSGMKRKVALLAVLTPQVPMIILDEPTNTLDPTMRDELLEQLREARARGQAVLFSSHVLQEVEAVCDRVGILRDGRLVHLQKVPELREGRSVRGRFLGTPPSLGPGDTLLSFEELKPSGHLNLEYRGQLQVLLDWLARHPLEDLRIEPMGLTPIYRRYHGEGGRPV